MTGQKENLWPGKLYINTKLLHRMQLANKENILIVWREYEISTEALTNIENTRKRLLNRFDISKYETPKSFTLGEENDVVYFIEISLK
ncbi:MAG: hypothetical protein K9L56_13110 [Clostridiales bacterium]|nr:hypothetical protein [Clostridiales bacterium]